MSKRATDLTREEVRELLRAQRAGYDQMEYDRLREVWREPTDAEKIAFDDFMDDVLRLPKTRGDSQCGLIDWYRLLMRKDR